jgi:hypothetical protein
MAIPKGLAARAVLELTDGRKVHIEIRDGSMFVKFYTSTRCAVGRKRTTGANHSVTETLPPASKKLRKLEKHFNTYGSAKVQKTTIKIYRKRLYDKRFKMRPDELGLARIHNSLDDYLRKRQQSPATFTRKTEAALT